MYLLFDTSPSTRRWFYMYVETNVSGDFDNGDGSCMLVTRLHGDTTNKITI
jgi:hypothetical protein